MEKIYVVTLREVYEDEGKIYLRDYVLTAHRTKELAIKFVKNYVEDAKEDVMKEHSNTIPKSYKFMDIDWETVDFNGEVPCYLAIDRTHIPGRGPFNYFLHIKEMEVFED